MSNIHCKVCHMEFSDTATICPGCGRPVDQAHPPATEPAPATDDQGPGITIGQDGEPPAGEPSEPAPAAPGALEPEQPA
jgi:hypothetical protein